VVNDFFRKKVTTELLLKNQAVFKNPA